MCRLKKGLVIKFSFEIPSERLIWGLSKICGVMWSLVIGIGVICVSLVCKIFRMKGIQTARCRVVLVG